MCGWLISTVRQPWQKQSKLFMKQDCVGILKLKRKMLMLIYLEVNTESLLHSTRMAGLEVNTEKIKYMFISHPQNVRQNFIIHKIHITRMIKSEDEIDGSRLHASPEGKRPIKKPSCV